MRIAIVRRDGQRLMVNLNRLVNLSLRIESHGEIKPRTYKFRTGGDGLSAVHLLILWVAHDYRP
jgi:hypothetical protein